MAYWNNIVLHLLTNGCSSNILLNKSIATESERVRDMVKFFSDTNSDLEREENIRFSIGRVDWDLSFDHKGLPVHIVGNSEEYSATVSLGNETTDICIKFPISTHGIDINSLVMQAKDMLDDYLEDYENGVN